MSNLELSLFCLLMCYVLVTWVGIGHTMLIKIMGADMRERTYGSMTTDEFLDKMISFFPEIKDAVEENFDTYGEILYTNIIEDEVMPLILELIAKDDQNRLKEIFEYFELVSENACQDLFNCFSSTALEILGNDRKVLNKAKEYMGPLTTKYQREADFDLGRNV